MEDTILFLIFGPLISVSAYFSLKALHTNSHNNSHLNDEQCNKYTRQVDHGHLYRIALNFHTSFRVVGPSV